MAQEILVVDYDKIGKTTLRKSVFETIVTQALKDVKNIVVDTNDSSIFQIKIINNELKVLINVTLKYGVDVTNTCEKLQQEIYNSIYNLTSIKCKDINIRVNGFSF